MRFARLLTVTLFLSGCHFTVQGVGVGGSGDPGGGIPGDNLPGTGSAPTLPDAPDLGSVDPPDLAPSAPLGGVVGDVCDATHPCMTGLDCLSKAGKLSFPAGYCSKNCGGPGPAGACPSGSTCTDVDKQHVCLDNCNGSGNCSGPNTCCELGGQNVCVQMTCG